MKRMPIYVLSSLLFIACNSKTKTADTGSGTTDTLATHTSATTATDQPTAAAGTSGTFDLNSIPVTDKKLGKFPYIGPPENYTYGYEKELNPNLITDFDREYFAVNGKLVRMEGKTFKARINKDHDEGTRFNSLIVDKSYENAIIALGGVKLKTVPVSNDEIKKIGDKELIENHYGFSLDYNQLDDIKTYVIRTADKEIWIQMSLLNQESGSITILEKGALKALKVAVINADQIKKDIETSGKAVLHINFDTDKATLKPDGTTAVSEIVKFLNTDKTLKLTINGYTDNVGDGKHNLKLSADRAASVLRAITGQGIDPSRLVSNGYGDKNPIGDNSTEDGKAQNRRVELVKN